jgi:predicted MPP superfamily phosphohydrolase
MRAPLHPLRRKANLVMLALLVAGSLALLYASAIEPAWLEVTRHRIPARVAEPLTIAHLSDLHTAGIGRRERALLAALEAAKPDLIAVTGDSIPDTGFAVPTSPKLDDHAYAGVEALLARLRAPLGVWLVRGNWENWRRLSDERAVYARSGATLLVNEGRLVRRDVWLAGLDDAWTGRPDVDAALRDAPPRAFRIVLFHAPASFLDSAGRSGLSLAGHTHGGQVRLPLLPPLWLPAACAGYVEGWYEREGSRMYVSRGIGTSTLPVRFLCRPELALVTLAPAGGGGPAPTTGR